MLHSDADKAPQYNAIPTPSHEELAALIGSPTLPAEPCPAYTPLPHRDVDFHLAPLLHGKIGDIELETTDGRRFLVHKQILEQETVFFHIYYGFIPVWRLNSDVPGPPHPCFPQQQSPSGSTAGGVLSGLLGIPKLFCRSAPSSPLSSPPVPPKGPITAPTPTSTPYTWVVPESSPILTAFLSLIYPRGTFTSHPLSLLTSLEVTGRVVRAALGYQSSKALNMARDHLSAFIDSQPLETYAMASYFKYSDLARLASVKAMAIPLLTDDHSSSCVRKAMIEQVWRTKVEEVIKGLTPDSELIELLNVDLRGGHCGKCLVLLGSTIQRCLYKARELPKSI